MTRTVNGFNPLAYQGVNASSPPNMFIVKRAPTTADSKNFSLGDFWLNPNTEILYQLVSLADDIATWIQFDTGAGPIIRTLTGNSGGPISPDITGTINVIGPPLQPGGGLTAGVGNTIVINPWIQSTVFTTDGVTFVPLFVVPVPAGLGVAIFVLLNAVSADLTRSVSGSVTLGGVNNAGTVRITANNVNQSITRDPNGNVATATARVAGTNIEIVVRGEVATNYQWTAFMYYITN